MKTIPRTWLLLILFVVLSITGIAALRTSATPASPLLLKVTASTETTCPQDWFTLPDRTTREHCAHAKDATAIAYNATQVVEARNRPTIMPHATTTATARPSGLIPPEAQQVKRINPADTRDWSPYLRGSTSIWQIGAVQIEALADYGTLYLLSRAPTDGHQAILTTELFSNNMSRKEYDQYHWTWEVPQNIGLLTITDLRGITIHAQGLRGIATFTSSLGHHGTFNFATNTWRIDPPSFDSHARTIQQENPANFAKGPLALRGSTSIWRLGVVRNGNDPYEHLLYLLSLPPQEGRKAIIKMVLLGDITNEQAYQPYTKRWEAPSDLGSIIITDASHIVVTPQGIQGNITFVTSSGQTGTVDLTKDRWVLP